MPPKLITLLTDFGLCDGYVGIMKGVILGIAPTVQLVDLAHEVRAQDVPGAALILRSAVPYFPPGSVHLAVVDPGVGSSRAPIAVATDRAYFVGPDNGLLAPAVAVLGGAHGVWRIDSVASPLGAVSQTFHGRDVFAPAAAQLAAGLAPEKIGAPLGSLQQLALPDPRRHTNGVDGEVIYVDRFGNLITNISAADLAAFASRPVSVSIGGVHDMAMVRAYSDAALHDPLAIINSWGLLEVAVREGNAAQLLKGDRGTSVIVSTVGP
jgi:S-adenosylmethionine hydrolase